MSAVEREKAALSGLESKLSDAMARRDKVIQDISVASSKAERDLVNLGQPDRRPRGAARNSLVPLNKQAKEIDAEIGLLRIQITHAKRDLTLQEAYIERARASADAGNVRRDKLFEVVAPDGRKIRHRGASQEDVQRRLQVGYSVTGQIFGANVDDTGGFIPRPGFLTPHAPDDAIICSVDAAIQLT
jgi:hypothetical protein